MNVKRGVAILAFLVIITITGGLLTSGMGIELPFIKQTAEPMASVFEAPGEKALWLIAMVGFIIFNVLGAGLTIAFLFWFLNREVKVANSMPLLNQGESQEKAIVETSSESA
jgi:hypothetical protein